MTVSGMLCCVALLLIVVVLPCHSIVDLLYMYAFSQTQRQCNTFRHWFQWSVQVLESHLRQCILVAGCLWWLVLLCFVVCVGSIHCILAACGRGRGREREGDNPYYMHVECGTIFHRSLYKHVQCKYALNIPSTMYHICLNTFRTVHVHCMSYPAIVTGVGSLPVCFACVIQPSRLNFSNTQLGWYMYMYVEQQSGCSPTLANSFETWPSWVCCVQLW